MVQPQEMYKQHQTGHLYCLSLEKAKCLFMLLDLEAKTSDLVRLTFINQASINF